MTFFFTFFVVSFWVFLFALGNVLPLLRELVHFRSLFFLSCSVRRVFFSVVFTEPSHFRFAVASC